MTCRAPLEAARKKGSKGKPIIYKRGRRPKNMAESYEMLDLPCKQCIGCRLEKTRVMAARMMHEAAYWEEMWGRYSIFLTLTYNDQHLPMYGTLVKEHAQNFLKRLRRYIKPEKLRYYAVGEYGSTCPDHEIEKCSICGPLQRPHYHMILFGWAPAEREYLGDREGYPIYRADIIEKAWRKTVKPGHKKTEIGSHEFGPCTYEACQYVARYLIDKQIGNNQDTADHYAKYLWQIDTWVDLPPEFAIISKGGNTGKKGIGYQWYEQYRTDIYPQDECPIPGRTNVGKPPRYYDEHEEKRDPKTMEKIKDARREAMAKSLLDGPSLETRIKYEDEMLKRRTRQ